MMGRKYTRIVTILLLHILILSSVAFASVGIEGEVSAYLLGDYETGEILEGYNIYQPMEVASITKIMSYLIVMDQIKANSVSLEDRIYIDEDITEIKGSSLDLEIGESFSLEELLEAVIVISANDATYALAKHVAGSEAAFVKMMNDKAKELGLDHSMYINSTGLPEGELQNIMSPEDIFILSRYIINKYPEILSMTTIPYIEVPSRGYKKENTNPLLREIEGIDGLKTGFTNKAGHCLVSTLTIKSSMEDESFRLIGIVMGTESEGKRKELGGKLIQYGIDNYYKKIFTHKDRPIDTLYIPKSRDKEIEVYPSRGFSRIVRYDDYIDEDIFIDEKLKLPLKEGDKIGRMVISIDGDILDEIDLVVNKDIKKAGIFVWIARIIKDSLSKVFLS